MYSIVPLGTRYNTELSLILCYSAQVCKLFSDTRESNNFQVRNTCHIIVWLLLRPNDKFEFKRRKKEKERYNSGEEERNVFLFSLRIISDPFRNAPY